MRPTSTIILEGTIMSIINPAQNNNYNNYQVPATQSPAAQPPANNTTPDTSLTAPQDTYTPSAAASAASTQSPTVRGPADPAAIRNLLRDTNHQIEAVRRLLSSALGRTDSTGQGWWAQRAENLNLTDAERAEAQALVAEDGFFGVSQTTDRIMDFARAMVGSNASPEQIEEMRVAVQRGFDDVARMFGGFNNLPEVTRDTHASIMAQFDDWAASAAGSAAATA